MLVTLPGLFRRRQLAALTQDQLATLAGLKRLTISRLEGGKPTRLTTVRKLADALDCRPIDLMEPE